MKQPATKAALRCSDVCLMQNPEERVPLFHCLCFSRTAPKAFKKAE